jgi:hypothetical protein
MESQGSIPHHYIIFAIFLQVAIIEFLLFDKLENYDAFTGRNIWSTLFGHSLVVSIIPHAVTIGNWPRSEVVHDLKWKE